MRRLAVALVVDIVAVIVFCAIGRRSHDEGSALSGLVSTAWPFLGGLAVGWLATFALYRDKFDGFSIVPTGLLVWIATVAVGMILRVIGGQGIAFSFVVVATIVLGVFLVGWRAIFRFGPGSKKSVLDSSVQPHEPPAAH